MQAKTTFQKFFFALIFVVTALMFYELYQSHQRNMAQKPCVTRTRLLLDMLTEQTLPDPLAAAARKIEISPKSGKILDSAVFLLYQWGRESRFSGYRTGGQNSGFTESIRVFYPPPKRVQDPLAPGLSKVAIDIQWLLLDDSLWRANLDIVSIRDTI